MTRETLWIKNFIFVSASNFFLFVSYYSLLVTFPLAAINDYQTSSSVAGLFTTFFLAAAIIIRPFLGSWIERFGKRQILVVSFVIFTVISFLYGFFQSVVMLLLLRFLQGLGFGMATASAGGIVADIVPETRKGEGIGYFVMSSNLGMVVGPFVGITFYGKFGINILFITVFICSFLALLFSWLIRLSKEVKTKQATESYEKPSVFEKGAVRIGITAAFLGISYSSILSFMVVFATSRGLEKESGYFFAVFAIVLLLSRPFTGVWFDRYGANAIVYPAIMIYGLGLLTLGLSNQAIIFFLAAALVGVGWGTLFSSFQTIAIQRSNPKMSSVATATFLSIFDLGIGGGSFLVGALANYINLGSMYIYFSIYILFGIAIYYWAQKERRNKKNMENNVQKQA